MPEASKERKTCRVLLIEDDPHDAFLFKRAVEDARQILDLQIHLDQVDDGLAALYLVTEQDLTCSLPDAVILDLSMPRLDGIKFLRALRKHLLLKNLPVLVLTTSNVPEIHEEAVRAGADKIFVKPSDMQALLRIALEMMGSHCPMPEVPNRRMDNTEPRSPSP